VHVPSQGHTPPSLEETFGYSHLRHAAVGQAPAICCNVARHTPTVGVSKGSEAAQQQTRAPCQRTWPGMYRIGDEEDAEGDRLCQRLKSYD
jgi:hypothetical protein